MSLTVTQRPYQTINSETSRWNAVGNPILYKMQRKDFTFNQINDSGGFVQLQFNAVNVTASFGVDDVIYFKSDNDEYDLFATVTSSAFSTNTLVTLSTIYTGVAPGGFANNDDLRPAYRVEVEIYRSDDDEILTETILENSPTSRGAVTIDVATIIRQFLIADNDADLTGSTESFDDTNGYLGFYIKYREVWLSSAESQTDDTAYQFFAILGSRQIPAPYGGNMGEYAVNVGNAVLDDTNFSSGWTNEISFGDPWTIGIDLSIILDGADSQRVRRYVDILQGQPYTINIIGSLDNDTEFDLSAFLGGSEEVIIFVNRTTDGAFNIVVSFTPSTEFPYIELAASAADANYLVITDITISQLGQKFLTKLERPVMWRGYPFLISAIINEDTAGDVYIDAGGDTSTPTDYTGKVVEYDLSHILSDQDQSDFDIVVYESDSGPDPEVTEVLTIELRDACDNPIFLMGRNSLGGVLQWMFDGSQDYTFDYGNGRKAKRLVLFTENLSVNEWESLQDFITLGLVYRNNIVELTSSTIKTNTRVGQQLYVVDAQGNKTGVVAIPTRNQTSTRQIKHKFEIEIEYPEIFNV